VINFLIVLFGVTMLYVAATSRIEAYVRMLVAQGLVLFLLVVADWQSFHLLNLLFLAVETLGFKAIIIPWFLRRVVRRNGVFRELEPYIPNFFSVVIASLIFAFGFLLAYGSLDFARDIKPLYFGVSVSTMLTGLLVITTRKMLVTHVAGYMMLENGIFLLSLSMAREMPLLVNLGVLLDIFLGIFLLGLFATKIKSTFDESKIDALTHLRD
jgi:hydrogenase-4 component E